MKNCHTGAAFASQADAANVRVFLQQAVDYYTQLVAFSFTRGLLYCETMTDNRSLMLCFHTVVWQQVEEYSRERQQERRSSPPTLLRWIWESASGLQCRMVLLMNCDTLGRYVMRALCR